MPLARIDQLKPRQHGVVTAIAADGDHARVARRLCEMGLDVGVDVELVHRAPFGGDPIAVRAGNVVIALRRAQAALITVEVEDRAAAPTSDGGRPIATAESNRLEAAE